MRFWIRTVVLILGAGAVAGCHGNGPKPATAQGPVVAKIGDREIAEGELRARLLEQPPFVRSRYTTLEKKKEFLDNLIRFEMLAEEARARGLDKDPEVQLMLQKVMVQKLVKDETEKPFQEDDAKLRKLYDQRIADYVKPDRVRVEDLFLAAKAGDKSRGQKKAEATKILADLKKKQPLPAATDFEAVVRAKSDDGRSKPAAGDLGLTTRDELAEKIGASGAEAAFKMQAIGELSGVIETDKGFHVLRLVAKQPGMNQTFEMVKPRLASQASAERRGKALEALVALLKTKYPVQIKEDVLEKMSFQANASDAGTM